MTATEILTGLGRVLARRWMPLLAWWLASVVLRDAALRLAAEVALHSAFAAGLLVSLAMLVRLVAFVAMLLLVRRELAQFAPLQGDDRVAAFAGSVLSAAIPFAAFYLASGLLEQDWRSYVELAGARWVSERLLDPPPDLAVIGLTAPIVAVIAGCLAVRLAWRRWGAALPWGLGIVVVLAEVLWVFLTAFLVDDGVAIVWEWLQSRQLAVWLDDLRAALAAPLAAVWDAAEPAFDVVFQAIVVPLAWLLTAATVLGRSLTVGMPERTSRRGVRAAAGFVADTATDHAVTVRGGLHLVARTGPVLLAAYCLLYALVGALEPLVFFLVTRAIGPHDAAGPVGMLLPAIALVPTLVVTPILVALVAVACNAAAARMSTDTETGSQDGGEADLGVGAVGAVHPQHDGEGALRVARHEEPRPDH